MDMDLIIIVGGLFLISVGYNVSRAILLKVEKSKDVPPELNEISRRLAAIEAAVDTIAIEVERTGEANRFVTQLLSEQRNALPASRDEQRRDEQRRDPQARG